MFFLMGLSGLGGAFAGVKATRWHQKRKAAQPGRPPHSYQRCRKRHCWQDSCKAYKAGHDKGFDEGRRSCPRKHAPGA